MIDSFLTFTFTIFVVICILIIAAIAYLVTPFLIALIVGVFGLTLALVIGWILSPRRRRDHYEIPFGDYPKVPHGR